MFKQISKFTNDHAGLEKILRFLQAVCMIMIGLTATSAETQPWIIARTQFGLGRRYFRYMKFIDCFSIASDAFQNFMTNGTLISLLEFGRWSCLGMYLSLEATTIMDALGIWKTTWAPRNMLEANRFWFFSILFSIVAGLSKLWQTHRSRVSMNVKETKDFKEVNGTKQKQKSEKGGNGIPAESTMEREPSKIEVYEPILRRLTIDLCDLTIPGFQTGWLKTTPVVVGVGSATSAILASIDIWKRVQK